MTPSRDQPGVPPLSLEVMQEIAHGVQLFDAGSYWHAHEAWEQAWRREAGSDRHFLKGLIQFAAALHHWHRGTPSPAQRLLVQAERHLRLNHSERWPFMITALQALVAATSRSLSEGAPPSRPSLLPLYRSQV